MTPQWTDAGLARLLADVKKADRIEWSGRERQFLAVIMLKKSPINADEEFAIRQIDRMVNQGYVPARCLCGARLSQDGTLPCGH